MASGSTAEIRAATALRLVSQDVVLRKLLSGPSCQLRAPSKIGEFTGDSSLLPRLELHWLKWAKQAQETGGALGHDSSLVATYPVEYRKRRSLHPYPMKRSSRPSRQKALTIFLKKPNPTASRSIASEGQQPTLNDQGVTVAKRVSARRATVPAMTMEELHGHAVTLRSSKEERPHDSGKGNQDLKAFSEAQGRRQL